MEPMSVAGFVREQVAKERVDTQAIVPRSSERVKGKISAENEGQGQVLGAPDLRGCQRTSRRASCPSALATASDRSNPTREGEVNGFPANGPDLDAFLGGGWLGMAARGVNDRFDQRGTLRVGERRLRTSPGDTARRLEQLIGWGRWRPRRPHEIRIPKPSGGTRTLAVLAPEDQVVHSALASFLSDHLEPRFLSCSWGFRPRRSARGAASRAARLIRQGRRWAADLDVEDCFGTIPHRVVLSRLGRLGVQDNDLFDLLELILTTAAPSAAPAGTGLAQGSPLSPLLANVHLHDVDVRMCREHGYQRYADDLVCLTRDRSAAARAWAHMDTAVRRGGQTASAAKSGVREVLPGWRLLGWELGDDGHLRPAPRSHEEESLEQIRKRYRRLRSRDPRREQGT